VPEFLVEAYVPRTWAAASGLERARAGAEELTREGTPVRLLQSIFVPQDETCFLLYEGGSVNAVRAAVRRGELAFERITEAFARTAAQDAPAGTSV
jgi:hypothetical protein